MQHTGPGQGTPNLATAVTDSAHGIATAYVQVDDKIIKADYPVATQGPDAVTAVLEADTLFNDFEIDPALGASSEWLVTFPTKQFYVDPAIVGSSTNSYIQPFEEVFGGGLGGNGPVDLGVSCASGYPDVHDREGTVPLVGTVVFSGGPVEPPPVSCFETSVLAFDSGGRNPTAALQSTLLWFLSPSTFFAHGSASIALGADSYEQMRPAANGNVFFGLPAVGFLAVNYINGNVTPRVLSNYSAAYPHRSTARCVNNTVSPPVCF